VPRTANHGVINQLQTTGFNLTDFTDVGSFGRDFFVIFKTKNMFVLLLLLATCSNRLDRIKTDKGQGTY